jgi:hypothetical protein
MSNSVENLVSSAKARLNALISAAACLDWAWKAALAGAALVLPLRFLGLGWQGLALWAILVAAAACYGYLRSLPRRLDSARAARWLDERYENNELLSAAVVCLERECSGAFDAPILESAEAFAAQARLPEFRLKPFVLKASWTSALCLACLAVIALAQPARDAGPRSLSDARGSSSIDKILESAAARPDSFQGKEARDLAYQLFPRDKRMASLVERALRDGRIEDLRKLLERAERDFNKRLDDAKSELDRQAVAEEMALFKKAMKQGLGGGDSSEGQDENGAEQGDGPNRKGQEGADPGSGGTDARPPDSLANGGQDSSGGSDSGRREGGQPQQPQQPMPGSEPSDGAGSGRDGRMPNDGSQGGTSQPGSGKTGGGKMAGVGRGEGVLTLAPKSPGGKAAEPLTLGEDEKDQMREMILPELPGTGKGAAPAFDSTRSAASAVSRTDLPLEYRDFAKSYFIRLTEGEGK